MTIWTVIVLLSIIIVTGLGVYSIRSLIRKWKVNPRNWIDLLVGIAIWGVAIGVLIVLFLRQAGIVV